MGKKISVKSSLEDLGTLLEEVYKEFSKRRGVYQIESDIISGNFRTPTGLIVPLQIHRFVYENHDLMLLQTYIQLFQHMLRAENEIFISTTFRIHQELGIKKIDIFFSGILSEDERKKAALVSVLSDWIMLSGNKYKTYFQKLLTEEKDILSPKGKKIFEKISNHILRNSTYIPISLLKTTKQYRNRLFAEYTKKIPVLTFIKGPNLETIISYWSELLHGNPLMLGQIFNEKLIWRVKNRLYAVLWSTGQHVLHRLEPSVQDKNLKARIKELSGLADNVWQQLTDEWKAEAKRKRT